MFYNVKAEVKTTLENIDSFKIDIGLHKRSAFRLYMIALVIW